MLCQMVQLLKEQMSQSRITSSLRTSLPQSSETVGDTARSLSTSLEPIIVSDVNQTKEDRKNATASPDPSDGSQLPGLRPPLLHSVSLPLHYGRGTSLPDASASSSLTTMLMDRMASLETVIAEQQRKSEADMARLLNQVCFHQLLSVHDHHRHHHYKMF